MQPKATKSAAGKSSVKHKFYVDFSKPVEDGVFDGSAFEQFVKANLKVDNKKGNLGENVKVALEGMGLFNI